MRRLISAFPAGEKQLYNGGTEEGFFFFFDVEKSTDVSENDGRGFEGRQPSTLAEYIEGERYANSPGL